MNLLIKISRPGTFERHEKSSAKQSEEIKHIWDMGERTVPY